MHRFFHFSLVVLLLFCFNQAYSNGGPIAGSAVYKASDVVLLNKPQIRLVHEDLKIKIVGDFSLITVSYMLSNEGENTEEVNYGFPIDFIQTDMAYELEWDDDYLPEFAFYLDEKDLKVASKTSEEVSKVELIDFKGDPYPVDSKRQWYTTSFSVESDQIVTLKVRYKIKNGFTDWATTKDFLPSFDKRALLYDFTPAGSWGDGKAQIFSATIDYSDLTKNGGSLEVSGLEMTQSRGVYHYAASNFDLASAQPLKLEYTNINQKRSVYTWGLRVNKDRIKNISVSSQLKGNYSKENLLDGNFATAWVEGKADNGVNEQIVIDLDDYKLAAIGIVAGYAKNGQVYWANNRVKKVRIEREVVNGGDPTKTSVETEEKLLKDLSVLETPDKNNFFKVLNLVGDYGGYVEVRKVTITILDTYNGTKYNDTCISEILLMGYE